MSSGGTLELPVLDDWRDPDGDPLVVTGATASAGTRHHHAGRPAELPRARDRRHARSWSTRSPTAGPRRRSRACRSPSWARPRRRRQRRSPQPDIARGEVGKPIRIKPLGNDLPGADPTNPNAVLALAGTVASPAGVRVTTDLKSGTVTVVAARHGTFVLNYTAAFGNAQFGHSIDPRRRRQPAAAAAAAGRRARHRRALRAEPGDHRRAWPTTSTRPAGCSSSSTPSRPLDNGAAAGGDRRRPVPAGQRPAGRAHPEPAGDQLHDHRRADAPGHRRADGHPAAAARARHPAGRTTTTSPCGPATPPLIPVLDNDIDPAGATARPARRRARRARRRAARRSRPRTTPAGRPGRGVRRRQAGPLRRPGRRAAAAAHGRPTSPRTRPATAPPARCTSPSCRRRRGRTPTRRPPPQAVESRVVSGDTVRITIPTTSIDPDGDTANVTGITSAPEAGPHRGDRRDEHHLRGVPDRVGHRPLRLQVTDPYGLTLDEHGQHRRRRRPTDPQPPVAVDDTVDRGAGREAAGRRHWPTTSSPPTTASSIARLRTTNPELPAGDQAARTRPARSRCTAPADGRPRPRCSSTRSTTASGDPSVGDGQGAQPEGLRRPADRRRRLRPRRSRTRPRPPSTCWPRPATPTGSPAAHHQGVQPHRRAIIGGKVHACRCSGASQNIVFEIANAQGRRGRGRHPRAGARRRRAVRQGRHADPGRRATARRPIDIRDYVIDPAGQAGAADDHRPPRHRAGRPTWA